MGIVVHFDDENGLRVLLRIRLGDESLGDAADEEAEAEAFASLSVRIKST